MGDIINLNPEQRCTDLPWITCTCGGRHWFVMVDPAPTSQGIVVALRCTTCLDQMDLDRPGLLPKELMSEDP